ncbi:MAG TPA: PPOX class F420-dependent oxidoreductase [Thermoleophilaceae bacterium]|jgi:PPOX class probable F420-dependent enzyme
MTTIADEQCVLATTFRRDGSPVSTPVWPVPYGDDGRLAFWTSDNAGKAKRLQHNPTITLQPCDFTGNVQEGSTVVEGTATIVTGAEYEVIFAAITAKYGTEVVDEGLRQAKEYFASRGGAGNDIGIVVTPSG